MTLPALLFQKGSDVYVHEARPGGEPRPHGDLDVAPGELDLAGTDARPMPRRLTAKAENEVLHPGPKCKYQAGRA